MTYHVTYTRESGTQVPREFATIEQATWYAGLVCETMQNVSSRLPDAITSYCVQNDNGMIIASYRKPVTQE